MEFSPNNPVVRLCLQGMQIEETGNLRQALELFTQAWHNAQNDFEKFLAAWYIARVQQTDTEKLQWYELALTLALKLNNDAVSGAIPLLYSHIADCHQNLDNMDEANKHRELASAPVHESADQGPFYHGTKADLQQGDLLTARRDSNYQPGLLMNHIYFTALPGGAGLAAALAQGDAPERVYIVEPTGSFEDDPNVTNKKFPGNPTRSYRTTAPLQVTGELTDYQRQTPEQLQEWRKKLAANNGEIIN